MNIEDLMSTDLIYHFTNFKTALELILDKNCFKFSTLNNTNDPLEYKKISFHQSWIKKNYDDLSKINEYDEEINRNIKRKLKIACFSTNEIPRIMEEDLKEIRKKTFPAVYRSRMWSQYADNHEGVCLVFSKSKLIESLQNIENINGKNLFYGNMTYQYKFGFNNVEFLDGNEMLDDNALYFRKWLRKNYSNLLLKKHIDYNTESEFRIIVFDPDNMFDNFAIDYSLYGIICGDKVSELFYPTIKKLTERYNAKCGELFWWNGEPNIIDL